MPHKTMEQGQEPVVAQGVAVASRIVNGTSGMPASTTAAMTFRLASDDQLGRTLLLPINRAGHLNGSKQLVVDRLLAMGPSSPCAMLIVGMLG